MISGANQFFLKTTIVEEVVVAEAVEEAAWEEEAGEDYQQTSAQGYVKPNYGF